MIHLPETAPGSPRYSKNTLTPKKLRQTAERRQFQQLHIWQIEMRARLAIREYISKKFYFNIDYTLDDIHPDYKFGNSTL